MAPSAVVFDLDYTLAVPERDRATLLDEATATAGVRDISREEYLKAHGDQRPTETRVPIFEALLDGTESDGSADGGEASDGRDPPTVARAYREAVEDALVPVPGAAELVTDLRDRYRVGLLTDGPIRAQRGKLETLGWTNLFDAVVVTGALSAAKPDRRAFDAVLDALDVSPSEAVYVGDNPDADVRGASDAGLFAVQVLGDDSEPVPEADATVGRDDLATELPGILAGFGRRDSG